MRGLGLFFGRRTRNVPIQLDDPNPIADYGNDVYTGNAGLDGYSRLSIASPIAQGNPPLVAGAYGRAPMGPADDFEE